MQRFPLLRCRLSWLRGVKFFLKGVGKLLHEIWLGHLAGGNACLSLLSGAVVGMMRSLAATFPVDVTG